MKGFFLVLVIRPMTENPHTKNIRRSDPVTRYQQYQQSWQAQKAPGEKAHKSLRWNVREQMLYHDEVVEKVGGVSVRHSLAFFFPKTFDRTSFHVLYLTSSLCRNPRKVTCQIPTSFHQTRGGKTCDGKFATTWRKESSLLRLLTDSHLA